MQVKWDPSESFKQQNHPGQEPQTAQSQWVEMGQKETMEKVKEIGRARLWRVFRSSEEVYILFYMQPETNEAKIEGRGKVSQNDFHILKST